MRRTLVLGSAVLILGISLGCSRSKAPPPPAPAPAEAAPPPPPVVHVRLERVGDARDGSTVALARAFGTTVAYVADEDDAAIRAVDLTTKKELSRTDLGGRPGQILVGGDGRLYVALRDGQAVRAFEATDDPAAALDPVARAETTTEPLALALGPDDATLYVASGWGHTLEGFSLPAMDRKLAVGVAREPRAVTVSSDGKTAFLAHASAGHVSAIALDDDARAVQPIDLGMHGWTEVRRRGRLDLADPLMLLFKIDADAAGDDGIEGHFICGNALMRRTVTFPSRVARQGYALAKIATDKGERILAPHMAVATGDALVTSSGYGGGGLDEDLAIPTEMFDVDVVDVAKRQRATGSAPVPVAARFGKNACRLPRAAAVDASRKSLFVSCLGVDRVIELDASSATPLASMKRAFAVRSGPTGIAIDPKDARAVVFSSFDRVVSVLDLGPAEVEAPQKGKAAKPKAPAEAAAPAVEIALGPTGSPLPAEAALGRKIFHTAAEPKISRDGRACASCHPDGRDDGLVWSTPVGPRQTIMLAGRVGRAAPFGWLGKHGSLQEHITITMKNLKGRGLSEPELDAVVSWLRVMKPPPRAKATSLDARAERGRELFNSSALACGSCHAEKTDFSDREAHDVGSATIADANRNFLVPSLRFVGGSAPYFHDGRYATLEDLLSKNDRMGDTKSLSPDDRSALAAYLRTL